MAKRRFAGMAAIASAIVAAASAAPAAWADDYADARADLVAAYQAEDFAAMRVAARNSLDARPEYPGALFNKALAEALDGDADAATAFVERHGGWDEALHGRLAERLRGATPYRYRLVDYAVLER